MANFCNQTGRLPVDPELPIRLLLVGCGFDIRFERRLCEVVRSILAHRWFGNLEWNDRVPDHSAFPKNGVAVSESASG